MACWKAPNSCSTRVRRMSEKRIRIGRFRPRERRSSTSSLRSIGSDPGPAGVTWMFPASLMEKKSRPQPLTLYSSRESLTVQALRSVCNCSIHLLRSNETRAFECTGPRAEVQREKGLRLRPSAGAARRAAEYGGISAPGQLGLDQLAEGLERPRAGQHAAVDEVRGRSGHAQRLALVERRPDRRVVASRGHAGAELGDLEPQLARARLEVGLVEQAGVRHQVLVELPELALLARAAGRTRGRERARVAVE